MKKKKKNEKINKYENRLIIFGDEDAFVIRRARRPKFRDGRGELIYKSVNTIAIRDAVVIN